MREFTVTWSMSIEAETAAEAAAIALGIHRDPDSIATVFRVDSDTESLMLDVDPETLEVIPLQIPRPCLL